MQTKIPAKTAANIAALKEGSCSFYLELFIRNNLTKREYWSSVLIKIKSIKKCSSVPNFVLVSFVGGRLKPKLISNNRLVITSKVKEKDSV